MGGYEYDGQDFGQSCDYDVHERNEKLTAENAALRAQLAGAVAALEDIAGVTMSMVVNTQHLADERGRIAREYLRKYTQEATR